MSTTTTDKLCQICKKKATTALVLRVCDDHYAAGKEGLIELGRRLKAEYESQQQQQQPIPIPPPPETTEQPQEQQETPETPEYELQRLVNEARTKQHIQELKYDDALAVIAEKHSVDMQTRGFFAHNNPDGDSPFDRAKKAGYTYRAFGENIATFTTAWLPSMTEKEIAKRLFDQWWNSAGHKQNMLSSNFNRQGLGIHIYGNKCWATQCLACKR